MHCAVQHLPLSDIADTGLSAWQGRLPVAQDPPSTHRFGRRCLVLEAEGLCDAAAMSSSAAAIRRQKSPPGLLLAPGRSTPRLERRTEPGPDLVRRPSNVLAGTHQRVSGESAEIGRGGGDVLRPGTIDSVEPQTQGSPGHRIETSVFAPLADLRIASGVFRWLPWSQANGMDGSSLAASQRDLRRLSRVVVQLALRGRYGRRPRVSTSVTLPSQETRADSRGKVGPSVCQSPTQRKTPGSQTREPHPKHSILRPSPLESTGLPTSYVVAPPKPVELHANDCATAAHHMAIASVGPPDRIAGRSRHGPLAGSYRQSDLSTTKRRPDKNTSQDIAKILL